MNNEPVAWMLTLPDGTHDWILDGNRCEGYIPLYAHPAKTLTDCIKLLENYADQLEDERPNKGLSDVVYECIAILKKASEK